MSPRKSNTDMIQALEQKLAEARAKEAAKSTTRVAYLVEAIKAIDEKLATVETKRLAAVNLANQQANERVAKLEEKRADLDAELADLAVADASQLTFTEPVEVEEV